MSKKTNGPPPADLVYGSIRQEILDQKKCQLQLFGMAITVTAAILAYGAAAEVGPLLYVAPMVINVLALIIILDKAISIQRKAGYLKMMEQAFSQGPWMWETHLDLFRSHVPVKPKSSAQEGRKHSYITTVSLMLVVLNLLCAGLCWLSPTPLASSRQEGWLDVVVLILLAVGPLWGAKKWLSLVRGSNSTKSITAKWQAVIKEAKNQDTEQDVH